MQDSSVTALVPVLGRPQNAKPLVESWIGSGMMGSRLFFLCTSGDEEQIAACADTEGTRYVGSEVSWPQKIVRAIELVTWQSEWYLLCADDVTFEPGWWEATQRFRAGGYQVIGTNDGANPRSSIAGVHTTHPLVHRDFHAMGHPSSPVWPGYHHWFVDDELVWTAKSRGVWAWCEQARITHHHPYFDESVAWDETYALGEANRDEDARLWAERAQMLGLAVR